MSSSATQTIELNGTGLEAAISVSIGTSPAGLSFSINGTPYTTTQIAQPEYRHAVHTEHHIAADGRAGRAVRLLPVERRNNEPDRHVDADSRAPPATWPTSLRSIC